MNLGALQLQTAPAPKSSKLGGGKESFRGHIASDTLGKTLAIAPSMWANFSCRGQAPCCTPTGWTLYEADRPERTWWNTLQKIFTHWFHDHFPPGLANCPSIPMGVWCKNVCEQHRFANVGGSVWYKYGNQGPGSYFLSAVYRCPAFHNMGNLRGPRPGSAKQSEHY